MKRFNKQKHLFLIGILLLCFPGITTFSTGPVNQTTISNLLVTDKAISITGETSMLGATSSYSSPGDINDDGIDDLLIFDRFSTFIYFGKAETWVNKSTSEADVIITKGSSTGDYQTAVGVGDINNDGIKDILISPFSCSSICYSYLFFGRSTTSWNSVQSLDNADVKFSEENSNDFLGHGLDKVGDVNGDGIDDFVISSEFNDNTKGIDAGKVYLVLGRENTQWFDSGINQIANVTFLGTETNAHLGSNVAGIGDVNDDGFNDFLLQGNSNSKRVNYLIFGRPTNSWLKELSIADYANITIQFPSENTVYSLLGKMMGGNNDINGDGISDFVMGAYLDQQGGINAGQVYLVFGKPEQSWPETGILVNISNFADVNITGSSNEQAGFSVANLGDFNNDGFSDIIFSSTHNSGNYAEKVSIIFGRSKTEWSSVKNGLRADQIINSENYTVNNPWFGMEVSGIGDINNDGFYDFIIGAPYANNQMGEMYIIFGSNFSTSTLVSSSNSVSSSKSNSSVPVFEYSIMLIGLIYAKRKKKKRIN